MFDSIDPFNNMTNETTIETMLAINEMLMVPYNLYFISFNCYYGVLEGYELLLSYGNFV